MTRSRPSVDRMLSASVHGTVLVVAGGAVVAVGLLYGLAVGATVATLGAQLVGYAR
ncbi:hypothetical protein NGM10_06870 [Halorussus salilacus]|uniref:hypothetical protein n=1 Tax=Halorussus salilacus TaxID=2953750 RepID=UPI00209E95A0|nr:hypothetical protein [Halorussus salilacus]USZ69450.1 hypothetical protein NGM10_06870 [Halorussus salilacus]